MLPTFPASIGSTVMRTVEGLTAATAISTGRPAIMMSPPCPRITAGVSANPAVVCPIRRSASRRFICSMVRLLSQREGSATCLASPSEFQFSKVYLMGRYLNIVLDLPSFPDGNSCHRPQAEQRRVDMQRLILAIVVCAVLAFAAFAIQPGQTQAPQQRTPSADPYANNAAPGTTAFP